MTSIQIDFKKEKITIKDQNKNLVRLIRFILALNVLNAVLFFLVFNNQEDALQWIWLGFAVLSVIALYFSLVKLSFQDKFYFKEIKLVKKLGMLGLFLVLTNGKYRKIFIPEESATAQKLMRQINREV